MKSWFALKRKCKQLNANLQWCNSKATFSTLWISFCMCKMPLSPAASSYVHVDDLTWSENIWPSPKISFKGHWHLTPKTKILDSLASVSGRKDSMRRMFLNLAEIHLPGVPAANSVNATSTACVSSTQTEKRRHESFSLYTCKSLKRAKWFQQVIPLLFILTNKYRPTYLM